MLLFSAASGATLYSKHLRVVPWRERVPGLASGTPPRNPTPATVKNDPGGGPFISTPSSPRGYGGNMPSFPGLTARVRDRALRARDLHQDRQRRNYVPAQRGR
jgi:hypothetical protein